MLFLFHDFLLLIRRYPRELRLRLKKYHENEAARDQAQGQNHGPGSSRRGSSVAGNGGGGGQMVAAH